MFLATHLIGFGAGGANATRVWQNVKTYSSSAATSYTFNSVATGGPGLLVVTVTAGRGLETGSVTSVTVGGNSCTLVAQATGYTELKNVAMISCLATITSTGGSQNIVVNLNTTGGNYQFCAIDCYVLSDLQSSTPYATSTVATTVSSTAANLTLSIPAGGVAIASLLQANNSTLSTTNITFDQNAVVNNPNVLRGWAVGSGQQLAAQSMSIVNTNGASSSVARVTTAASWI
jgi:hypothetical protein